MPTLYCDPDHFKENLIKRINENNLRSEIGNSEHKFVLDNWIEKKLPIIF